MNEATWQTYLDGLCRRMRAERFADGARVWQQLTSEDSMEPSFCEKAIIDLKYPYSMHSVLDQVSLLKVPEAHDPVRDKTGAYSLYPDEPKSVN